MVDLYSYAPSASPLGYGFTFDAHRIYLRGGRFCQAVGTTDEEVIEMFDGMIENYLGGDCDLDETITRMNALIYRLTHQAA